MRTLTRWALVVVAAAGMPAMAEASADGEAVPPLVQALWPGIKPEQVRAAPVAGWREIVTPDGLVVYLDPSQRYVITGHLLDLWTRRDLTSERLDRERVTLVREIADDDVLWIKPEGPVSGRLYVFDDPDCPYCREAHPRLAELTAQGVEVGVILYPIMRLHPEAYGKSVAVWCLEDRRAAFDRAMRGESVGPPQSVCEHPIDRNIRLGRRVGVTGTPYWVAPSGRALAGVRGIDELLALSRESGAAADQRPVSRSVEDRP